MSCGDFPWRDGCGWDRYHYQYNPYVFYPYIINQPITITIPADPGASSVCLDGVKYDISTKDGLKALVLAIEQSLLGADKCNANRIFLHKVYSERLEKMGGA